MKTAVPLRSLRCLVTALWGLELPLACHYRIAAKEGAQIGLPEMDLGSVPAWGGSARLPRAVGRTHALDMILRGRKIDGAEAYRIGLVTELVEVGEIKARAQALGEEIAAQPRQAVKSMLEVVVGHETKSLAESMEDEMAAVAANRGTKDSEEGMRAFMEKRTPVFNPNLRLWWRSTNNREVALALHPLLVGPIWKFHL